MPRFDDIYEFLGRTYYNNIKYNVYNEFDKTYNYSFRQGETKKFEVIPNSRINLNDYDNIGVYMYSNDTLIHNWTGRTSNYSGDTNGEIYINNSKLTINLNKNKSNMLVPGLLKISMVVEGTNRSQYQVFLGVVYKGYSQKDYP